jgi:hypothetical protein
VISSSLNGEHGSQIQDIAALGFIGGFVVMMTLDVALG